MRGSHRVAVVLLTVATVGRLWGQTAAPITARAVPVVRVERLDNGVVRVLYDLAAPGSRFDIALEASNDGGRTFGIRPQAVRGDVGRNIQGGAGKSIEWESARDIDELQIDRLVFRIMATAATPPGDTRPPSAPTARSAGSLKIVSGPAGASVAIDGQARGRTPITLSDVGAGDHRVTLTMDGYLENSRTVTVAVGRESNVQVTLTPNPRVSAKKGGMPKWLLPAIGAGAAGAVVAATSGGSAPEPARVDVFAGSIGQTPPGSGIAAATVLTFTAQGFSASNASTLSYTWQLGDNTADSGLTVQHRFQNAGQFDVSVTAAAPGGSSASATLRVQIRSLSGLWNGSFTNGAPFTLNLTQNGASLTGTYNDGGLPSTGPRTSTGQGTVSNPRAIDMTLSGSLGLRFMANADETLNVLTGTLQGLLCSDGLGPTTCSVRLTR